ncbi:MAG: Hsp20/alpha crystallin family protein [Candidatus Hydrogenedentes bacterium]|jgi:HSP20 family protein|nr:Hsp20/alpha crystallin family protein [Candidatus Hydrogenedentota bacterium]
MTRYFWEPFAGLDLIRRDIDRLFEQAAAPRLRYARSAFLPGVSARSYPLINMREDSDTIHIEALAPGLNPDSIGVTVQRDQLRLEGEKAEINPDIKQDAYHRNERGAGRFTRVIQLPAEVDSDQVVAEYKNGLLLLTLPKHAAAKPKQIAVTVS